MDCIVQIRTQFYLKCSFNFISISWSKNKCETFWVVKVDYILSPQSWLTQGDIPLSSDRYDWFSEAIAHFIYTFCYASQVHCQAFFFQQWGHKYAFSRDICLPAKFSGSFLRANGDCWGTFKGIGNAFLAYKSSFSFVFLQSWVAKIYEENIKQKSNGENLDGSKNSGLTDQFLHGVEMSTKLTQVEGLCTELHIDI